MGTTAYLDFEIILSIYSIWRGGGGWGWGRG
jgi:hypothetical protein